MIGTKPLASRDRMLASQKVFCFIASQKRQSSDVMKISIGRPERRAAAHPESKSSCHIGVSAETSSVALGRATVDADKLETTLPMMGISALAVDEKSPMNAVIAAIRHP